MKILLHLSLLGMVMLAVVGRPLYSSWCVTHQLGHTLGAFSQEKFREDSSAERQLDAEHASGAHGQLHGDDVGGEYADIATAMAVPAVYFDSVPNPYLTELPVPVQHVTNPFRPPMA